MHPYRESGSRNIEMTAVVAAHNLPPLHSLFSLGLEASNQIILGGEWRKMLRVNSEKWMRCDNSFMMKIPPSRFVAVVQMRLGDSFLWSNLII